MKTFAVYKHTSPAGKVYIGCTSQNPLHRWGTNGSKYRDNLSLWEDIQTHGWGAFKHEVLAEGLRLTDAEAMERALIAQYQSTDPSRGYNKGPGGESLRGGYKMPEKARARIRAATVGKRLSIETRKKLSAARKGWKPSEETRAKMSEASRGRPSPNKGKTLTSEHREHLRKASKKTPVKNLDTGEVFESINAAARQTGLHAYTICAACKGKQKTSGGYRWAYEGVIA